MWFYAFAAGAFVLDQAAKVAARGALQLDRPITVIPGFFDLRLSYNSGAAFGTLPDWAPLFVIVAAVAVFAIFRLGRAGGGGSPGLAVGLGLLLGGALGNLADRLASPRREVTDFLSFHVSLGGQTHTWPTFNLADAAIVIGAFWVFLHVYVIGKRRGDTAVEIDNSR